MRQTCEECGEVFDGERSSARYCSSRCRQKAYRTRAREERLSRPTGERRGPAKRAAKRERELRELRKSGKGNSDFATLVYRITQATRLLESIKHGALDPTPEEFGVHLDVGDLVDALTDLQSWMDYTLAWAVAFLDDAAKWAQIRYLRNPAGRTDPEIETANSLADRIERRLNRPLPGG
jgi:hypothetical protein